MPLDYAAMWEELEQYLTESANTARLYDIDYLQHVSDTYNHVLQYMVLTKRDYMAKK